MITSAFQPEMLNAASHSTRFHCLDGTLIGTPLTRASASIPTPPSNRQQERK
jgi:hypothetical protein